MGAAQAIRNRYTAEEYLRLEREAADRHEYRDGEIRAMAGGSPIHSLIIANFIREAGTKLKGKPCRVYDSNLRVQIPGKTIYTYPDASILCDPPRIDPRDPSQQTVTNPTVIVEVLSPATEAYDRGEKFEHYRRLDSLREYVLVSQQTPLVETFIRQPDSSWVFRSFRGMDCAARLRSGDIEIPLPELYSGIDFTEPET